MFGAYWATRTTNHKLEQYDGEPALPQPPPQDSRGAVIVELVADDLYRRAELGVQKYGKLLRAGNGRDALVDAYQEALDLVMYLRQVLAERE